MPTSEQIKKQLFELGILTLITVLVWTGYGVYTALTEPSQSQVTKEELRTVPTNLDLKQLESLKNKVVIDDNTLTNFSSGRKPVIEEGTPSALLTPPLTEVSESTSSAAPSSFNQ